MEALGLDRTTRARVECGSAGIPGCEDNSSPVGDADEADFRGGKIQGGFIPRLPIPEASRLHELIKREPSEAVAELLKYTDVDDWEAPGWPSAMEAVHATVEEHPDDGVSILLVIAEDTQIDADASQSLAETVLSALNRVDHSRSQIDGLQAVLPRLWKTGLDRFHSESHAVGPTRWLDAARNHWAGKLTELWIAMIDTQWRKAGETWSGFDNITSAALNELLDGNSKPSHHAQIIVANKILFL